MIRPATFADIPEILDVALAATKQMGFAEDFCAPSNVADMSQTFIRSIMSGNADLAVVELDGAVCGFSLVELAPILWNASAFVARECGWHMHPEFPQKTTANKWFIRLLDHMLAWSRSVGASTFVSSAKPGMPACKLLERRGVYPYEIMHLGVL